MSAMSLDNVIWLIICIAGNMFQIHQISDIFFSYKVTTSTSVLFPTTLEPPNTIHSYYLLDIVKWEELFKLKPQLREELRELREYTNKSIEEIPLISKDLDKTTKEIVTAKVFKDMTIDQVMKLVYSPDEILDACMSINKDTLQIDTASKCTDHFNIGTYFHDYLYRDIVFEPKNAEVDFMSVKMATGTPGFLYSMTLKPNILQRVIRVPLTYNPRGEKFSVGFSQFVMLKDVSQWVMMSFVLSIARLLPQPFPTKCVDYHAQGFKGRGDCYDACATNLSLERLGGKLYPGPVVDPDFPHLPISIRELTANASMVETVRKITNQCNAKCSGYECLSQILVPSIDATYPIQNTLLLTVILKEPCVDTVYSQSLGLIEYITAAGSTLGFWIGLSLFQLMEVFKSVIKIVRKLVQVKSGWGRGSEEESENDRTRLNVKSFERKLTAKILTLFSYKEAKWQERADLRYEKKKEPQYHPKINPWATSARRRITMTDTDTRRSILNPGNETRVGSQPPDRQYYTYNEEIAG